MKARYCCILLLLAGCAGAATAPASRTLRVLTYNIHAGKDVAQQVNLDRVAALIQQERVEDVQAAIDRHAFARAIDFQGGEYGIGLLSRFPLDSLRVLPLAVATQQTSYEPRVGLYAQVKTPRGRLHVLNTHLDQSAQAAQRSQELMGLLAFVQRNLDPSEPLVLGGDLNTRPESPEIAALNLTFTDSWARCGNGGSGHTFPAHAPDRRIDYLLLRGTRCASAQVITSEVSDHRPLLVTIEF